MRSLILSLALALSFSLPAIADEVVIDPKPKAEPKPASVVVQRNENGVVTIDGETYAERHPAFEKRVVRPVKLVFKPVVWADRVTRFQKVRKAVSDFVIVGGAKFEPYQPAAGAVITASQITNLVAPSRK